MADAAQVESARLLSQAIHENKAILLLLLQLEIERNIKETNRSVEEVTEEFKAKLAVITENITENLSNLK